MVKQLSVYLPDELYGSLSRTASVSRRSVSAQIVHELEAGHAPAEPSTPKPATAVRLPADFTVTPEMITWAREHTPSIGRLETENFIDYWRSASGANARKLDWVAAWRNWMRKSEQQSGGTVKSREQRERDALFDRAYDRATQKEVDHESDRGSDVGQVRRRALPPAEDG